MIDQALIEKNIDSLGKGWIALLEVPAESLTEAEIVSLKALVDRNIFCIVLSGTKPYTSLLQFYNGLSLDTNKIAVIDCVTGTSKQNVEGKVWYMDGPNALTQISIAMSGAICNGGEDKAVLVDTLTSFLMHNKTEIFVRFAHSLVTKARINGASCLLLSVDDTMSRETRAEIVQLCDKVISVHDKL
ncbi:MAG: hypothetical protein HZB68_01495 [Candidatus Aenigmarchaeota archaeon]|nr:hypothetical protein [Candidatus Aenigmarchaeota archaeon]